MGDRTFHYNLFRVRRRAMRRNIVFSYVWLIVGILCLVMPPLFFGLHRIDVISKNTSVTLPSQSWDDASEVVSLREVSANEADDAFHYYYVEIISADGLRKHFLFKAKKSFVADSLKYTIKNSLPW